MATYAETIAALRAEREEVSTDIERMRARRQSLTVQITALERAITPPKQGSAKPDDIVMQVEPGNVALAVSGKR